MTTPPVTLDQARAAYRLGRTALQAARSRESTGICDVVELAGETALAAQPMLAVFLSEGLLGAPPPATTSTASWSAPPSPTSTTASGST
ncbi:hypothetical protein [Paractinoplanes durhamensis]|uniref:hypothetical protein n=1 Tax=Paractinoplanes durhamensis TaxID=113563 RepID=UPI00362535D8